MLCLTKGYKDLMLFILKKKESREMSLPKKLKRIYEKYTLSSAMPIVESHP